ncbi:MAG: hypothetical protein K2M90_08450 [Treponemataceae bacterium]|nr:hypothetical protein [Treponemataceae bacterium]MDE7392470.1 hypothetical protein [Treponemataceae bacterium]
MKKIISVAVVAAVAVSATFADLKSSLNVRMGGSVFSNTRYNKDFMEEYNKTARKAISNSTKVMDLGSSDFGADGLTFKLSNDYAGVTLNWGTSLQSKENGKNQATLFWISDGNGKGIELSAWLKPTEWLKFQVGAHKDGIFTAEQVKKDTDDTSWSGAGKYAFLHKPGVITQVSSGYFLDSLTDVGNGGQTYLYVDFSFADVGPGTLTFRPTLVSTGVDFLQEKDKDSDAAVMKTALGLMAMYQIADVMKVNVDFQMPTSKDIAFGIYGSPLGLLDGNLQLMAGFTFSTNTSNKDDKLGFTTSNLTYKVTDVNGIDGSNTNVTFTYDTSYYAADLRVRYVAGNFHIANAFNFTGASEDKAVVQKNGSKKIGNAEIWDAVFLTYKLNDNWTITGNVQLDAVTGVQGSPDDDASVLDLYVTPGIMYTVGKGATITCGLHLNFLDIADGMDNKSGKTNIAVPFVFRVKM